LPLPIFDVFMSYHSTDRFAIGGINEALKGRGISTWFDVEQLRPGVPWQVELEHQIGLMRSAAVFFGKSGIGPWQDIEVQAFLREFVNRKCPVIPVILSGVRKAPPLPRFLSGMTWVDFRLEDPDPIEQLVWGVTGCRKGTGRSVRRVARSLVYRAAGRDRSRG
jgi:hypothetical protein